MQPEIAFVVPDESAVEEVARIALRFDEHVTARVGNWSKGVDAAKEAVAEGAKVIASRWSTAALIRRTVDIPVVDIPVTGYDVIQAIWDARQISRRVGLIGTCEALQGIERISGLLGLLGVILHRDELADESEVEYAVNQLVHEDVEVVVGGAIVTEVAQRLGVSSMPIRCGAESIIQALLEARTVLVRVKRERTRLQQLAAALDLASEAVIVVNSQSKITALNPTAERMLGIPCSQVTGQLAEHVLPGIDLHDALRCNTRRSKGTARIGKRTAIVDVIPIVISGNTEYAVVILRNSSPGEESGNRVVPKVHRLTHVARHTFDDIVYRSGSMRSAINQAVRYASSESPVLLLGETGVGKEMFAQSIHNASPRRNGPFVAANCAGLPGTLLESELFGYVEGAFTGAKRGGKAGLFELADGGTLFLDEIGEMPLGIQGQFLRVIEQKKFVRLGDEKVIHSDFRVISATNRNLLDMVARGEFRGDLYYRLNVLNLQIPPLRERREDIPILVQHFLGMFCSKAGRGPLSPSPDLLMALQSSHWPGNVRELTNLLEKLAVLSSDLDKELQLADYLAIGGKVPGLFMLQDGDGLLARLEKRTIEEVLREVGGNRKLAAAKLGISTQTLWRRMKEMGMYEHSDKS